MCFPTYCTVHAHPCISRIKDPSSTRTIHLGIGFRERDTAFDFKNALNEFVRYVDRMSTAEEMHKKVILTLCEDSVVFSFTIYISRIGM